MALNFDDMKLAVEAVSGGENTVICDDTGYPSIMVPISKLMNSDLISGGSSIVHPGFQVDSVEKDVMYFSKFQNVVLNERGYSLPLREPKHTINFDTSLTYCQNKGSGWSLTPFSLWAAVALWTRKNGTMPHGNNNYGQDASYSYEKGTAASYGSDNKVNRILTGSGPKTWYHDHTKNGIADLNGNINEWCGGLRTNSGEINIIPYANCMDSDISQGASSTAWKAILEDGSLVEPGTADTLKYDNGSTAMVKTKTSSTEASKGVGYTSLGLESGLTAPELAKALILYPDEPSGDYGGDYRYWDTNGERLAFCGGGWGSGGDAGVFYVVLSYPRSVADASIGFRAAYCEL